jgi:hypothetical protein
MMSGSGSQAVRLEFGWEGVEECGLDLVGDLVESGLGVGVEAVVWLLDDLCNDRVRQLIEDA